MKMYIRIENGLPIDHPILEENFVNAYPNVDLSNTTDFVEFVRVPPPVLGVYEIYEGVSYGLINGVYTDIHQVRSMTTEEKKDKQDQAKIIWGAIQGPASWIFDEDTCHFQPPIPLPADHLTNQYIWDETTLSWIESTPLE